MFSNVKEAVKLNVRKAAVSVTKLNRTVTSSLGRSTEYGDGLPAAVQLFEVEGVGELLRRSCHHSVHASLPPNFFTEVHKSNELIEEGIEELWYPLERTMDRMEKRKDRLEKLLLKPSPTAEASGSVCEEEGDKAASSGAAAGTPLNGKAPSAAAVSTVQLVQRNAVLMELLTKKLQTALPQKEAQKVV